MLIGLIIALILGLVAGCISGLIPGFHINLVAAILTSLSSLLILSVSPLSLVIFIVSMSITHIFIAFIPSIFLGAPDEDTSLSVLPGHKYLLEGDGHSAFIYTVYGCLIAIPIVLLLTLSFIAFLPLVFDYLRFVMFLILVTASAYMIIRNENKLISLAVFILAGFLGISSMNLNINESLLPLLSGLFGSSSLITSITKKQKIPEQKILKLSDIKVNKKEISDVAIASLVSAPLCSFLPALGSSQAAIIGSDFIDESKNQKKFLMLLGSINLLVMALSFVTLYSINKSRTGSAAAVSKILQNISLNNLVIISLAVILTSIIVFFLSIFISRFYAKNISKINYSKLSLIVLIFLCFLILFFSGALGFLLFAVSTLLGLAAIYSGARRTNLMGCLMLPSILFYLPF
jgi:putative membrane protein